MIKEKNPLLKLKLQKSISSLMSLYINNVELFYDLYDIILEAPFENIWFEIMHILFGYLQLVSYLFDATVSNILLFFPLVFPNLESNYNYNRIISDDKTSSFNSSFKRTYHSVFFIYGYSLSIDLFYFHINYILVF